MAAVVPYVNGGGGLVNRTRSRRGEKRMEKGKKRLSGLFCNTVTNLSENKHVNHPTLGLQASDDMS